MPIKEHITLDETIEFLNELLKIDEECISKLMFSRHKCNQVLSEHPTVQVGLCGPNEYEVGPLGLLNGLFGVDKKQFGAIAAISDKESGKIERFVRLPQNHLA